MGTDLFRTDTRLVRISLVFTWDLRIQYGSDLLSGTKRFTYEGDPMWSRTVPVQNRSRVNRVDPIPNGSEHLEYVCVRRFSRIHTVFEFIIS